MLFQQDEPTLDHARLDHLIAIDTETTMIEPRAYGYNRKTRIEPFKVPDLVVGSIAWRGCSGAVTPKQLRAQLLVSLAEGFSLVFHHCAFDIPVILKAFPDLRLPFELAVDENRIHDTMILQTLVDLANGKDLHQKKTLASLAKRYLGRAIEGKDTVRCDFGQYLGRPETLPQAHLKYAADDAACTLGVYKSLRLQAERFRDIECRYPQLPDAEAKFGLLGEGVQIKGALGLEWLSSFPLRVDVPAAKKHQAGMEAEAKRLQDALVSFKYARRGPRSGKFSLATKKVRQELGVYAQAMEIIPELSDTGLVTTKYDFWSPHIKKISNDLLENPTDAETTEEKLSVYMRFARVRLQLTRYIYPYASSDVHYPTYRNMGARTTRTAAATPPVQQVPKRKDGIRSLFVPSDGRVLVEGDYIAAELSGMAQIYHLMFGGSSLGDAINAGADRHVQVATAVFGERWVTADAARRKELRQAAKAVSFGLCGGMGARKFSEFARGFGVRMDVAEAKLLRNAALEADAELSMYLREGKQNTDSLLKLAAKNLCMGYRDLITHLKAWRNEEDGTVHEWAAWSRLRKWARDPASCDFTVPTPPGFNARWDLFRTTTRGLDGFVRGKASYTEQRNSPFQAAVASAIKIAIWELSKLWNSTRHGARSWAPVTEVHDSIVIEVEPELEEKMTKLLERCMITGIRAICPDIKAGVEIDRCGRAWGTSTSHLGQAIPEENLVKNKYSEEEDPRLVEESH